MFILTDTYAAHNWEPEIVYTLPCRGHECGTPVLVMDDDSDICPDCDGWESDAMAAGYAAYANMKAMREDDRCPVCGAYGMMNQNMRCMTLDCVMGDA